MRILRKCVWQTSFLLSILIDRSGFFIKFCDLLWLPDSWSLSHTFLDLLPTSCGVFGFWIKFCRSLFIQFSFFFLITGKLKLVLNANFCLDSWCEKKVIFKKKKKKKSSFLCYVVPLPSTLGIAKVSKKFHSSRNCHCSLGEQEGIWWINTFIQRSQTLDLIFLDKKCICLMNFQQAEKTLFLLCLIPILRLFLCLLLFHRQYPLHQQYWMILIAG